MKKIAIIGTAGVPARYGGFETLVHHLVTQWEGKYDVKVYCSKKFYRKGDRPKRWRGAELIYLPFNANGIQSIIYDIFSILHALFVADTLIVLGVSGGIAIPIVKQFTRKKIIVNIDGLEWRRPKWSLYVQKFLKFSEYLAVKFSDIDITDNAALKRYTAIKYGTLSYLVAYGADHVSRIVPNKNDRSKFKFLGTNYAFKVCRIEPENNIHIILEAFRRLDKERLVIVGNWDNSEYGRELKDKYNSANNIEIFDPIYDQRELDLLRSNCSLYVHGHSAGGTNPSLVEAMYLGLPIVAFDVVYNKATMRNKGAYFSSVENLKELVQNLTSNDKESLSHQMLSVAEEFYTWKVIANKYHKLIMSLDHNYTKTQVDSEWSNLSKENLKELNISHLKNTSKFYNH